MRTVEHALLGATALLFIGGHGFAQSTALVSLSSGSVQGNGPTTDIAISESSRWAAYQSGATNLVASDTNGADDIFLHDRNNGTTTRVSVATGGAQANGASLYPSLSRDARRIAFESTATNLAAGFGPTSHVHVHDTGTGTTTPASYNSTTGTPGNGASSACSISLDGKRVVFQSSATNLVSGDTNGLTDVFLFDLTASATTRVSVSSLGAQANGANIKPSISANGRFVTFVSSASNLVSGDANGVDDVFLHDTLTGTTTRASLGSTGVEGNGPSVAGAISPDGDYVAIASDASNFVPADSNGARDIFVRALATGATLRVSVATGGGQSNGNSFFPTISWWGKKVAFHSVATNLVLAPDTNGARDVFMHEVATGVTTRISQTTLGSSANGTSWMPVIAPGGRAVSYSSTASNLVAGDTNGTWDAFVHSTPPTTWYVDISGTPPGTGTSADPYTSIQYAIQQPAAASGDTIRVRPGTYVENVDLLGKSLVLESTAGSAVTTIDGNQTGSVVYVASGEGSGTTIRGLTLTNGSGTYLPPGYSDMGGGVFCSGASLLIEDCVVDGNGGPSVFRGGGVFCSGASVQITGSTIANNWSSGDGGGVFLQGCTALVDDCTVSGNATIYSNGGGIFILGDSATVSNSTVSGNVALDGGHGAGLAQGGGTLQVTACTITGNDVYNGHEGGGLFGDGGTMTVTDTAIAGNFSSYGGGASARSGHSMHFENCVIEGNASAPDGGYGWGNGGGVFARAGASVSLKLCTVVGNSAFGYYAGNGEGGGVWGAASLEKCTLALNTAVTGGGACGATLHNCIVWDNTPSAHCAGTVATWSNLEAALAGTGNISSDPLFWNPLTEDVHLRPGSPCIDAGDPTGEPDPDGSRADMGAYPFDADYCSPPASYCTAGISASGCQASISATGTPSATASSGFLLNASSVEGAKNGLFFFGSNGRQANPWGNGTSYQCVTGPVKRGGLLTGVGTSGACNGAFTYDLNARWTSKPSSNPGAGVLVQAQLWYRDPFNTSSQKTSLSNAIEFGVCP